MYFQEIQKNHLYIIHYLLKKYKIQYNYDEYKQLLLIKMWELSKHYNRKKGTSLNTFFYTRLNYYLIDLFRKCDQFPKNKPLNHNECALLHMEDVDNRLEFEQLLSLLTYKEQQWLLLKLAGFKQNELASILNCSISTLKNYQKRIQRKYSKFYNNA